MTTCRLTALRKPGGGVRGIATGDCFRRLVAHTLAKQRAPEFDAATRPFQYALQARSGTDALATQLRVALERAPDAVVVSLDGRAAYDTMSRESFLTALQDAAQACSPWSASSMSARPYIIGGTTRGGGERCIKEKAASRGTPLLRRCMPLVSMPRYSPPKAASRRMKRFSHSWMTSTP